MEISELISEYKAKLLNNGGLRGCKELYKWELLSAYANDFNVDSENFIENLPKIKFGNLIEPRYSRPPMNRLCEQSPNEYREIIRQLYDESIDINIRVSNYKDQCKRLYEKVGEDNKSHNQDERVAATLLSFRYPQKYTFYLPTLYDKYCEMMGITKEKRPRYKHYLSLLNDIVPYIKADKELCDIIETETEKLVQSDILIAQDLIYQLCINPTQTVKKVVNQNGLYSCDIDISVDEWKEVLQDDDLKKHHNTFVYLQRFYSEPDHRSTCKNLSEKYDESPQSYNAVITSLGKFTQKKLGRFKVIGADGEDTYWIIPMMGQYVKKGKYFEWQLRPELVQAMEELEIIDVKIGENRYVDILKNNKNIILQGAPGTGKTYSTAALALSIIGESYDPNNHKQIMEKYQKFVDQKRISFTTFHQSMDYEDFVEGLRPKIVGDNVSYYVRDGIFKTVCIAAEEKDELLDFEKAIDDLKDKASIQSMTLKTTTEKDFYLTCRDGRLRVRPSESDIEYPFNIKRIKEYYKSDLAKTYSGESYIRGICEYIKQNYNVKPYNEENTQKKQQNYVLIIDEINRGNVSKIFGELITLLEKDKRQGGDHPLTATLPYSGELFTVPSNLYIIGTMNTTDRSVGHIDYAVRRRFAFCTLKSSLDAVISYYEGKDSTLLDFAVELFERVNSFIEEFSPKDIDSEDLMVGHSYFMANSISELEMKLEYAIIPLIREYEKDGILNVSIEDLRNNEEQWRSIF